MHILYPHTSCTQTSSAHSHPVQVLNSCNCSLVGGHTTEGPELSLGFSVTGEVSENEAMTKGGLVTGQSLILTKALGTGTLLAAAMRGKAKGRWVMGALEQMCQPSGEAARLLREHGAKGATDVTGFGLVGHLVEMTRPSQVRQAPQFQRSVSMPCIRWGATCVTVCTAKQCQQHVGLEPALCTT